jgi:hypothetical protein
MSGYTNLPQEEIKENEHSDQVLTPWEKDLKILEDWLCHLDIEEDYQKETFMLSEEGI